MLDKLIDDSGIDQGTVARQPHDMIARTPGTDSADETAENVVEIAPPASEALGRAKRRNRIIARMRASCYDERIDTPSPAGAIELPAQHRTPFDWPQHLPRQAPGGHAGLQNCEDTGRPYHLPSPASGIEEHLIATGKGRPI